MQLQNNQLIVFQGDSITDANRSREDTDDLGEGYVRFIAAWLSARYPAKNLRFLNRGISGNRVSDLKQRWTQDCIDLKPNWLSIMIGINDTWRRFDSGSETSAAQFEAGYRELLTRAKNELDVHLILCEPFLLPYPDDRIAWRADFDPKIDVIRNLAREFKALYIPLDGMFAAAATQQPMKFWLPDGVHPSPAGHALIAQRWLETVGA